MTAAQYNAIQHIAEEYGRTKAGFLNIRIATVKALAKRGWIGVDAQGYAFVTDAGWNAVEAL